MNERRYKTMLEQLKNLNIERMDLDNAVGLAAYGRAVEAEYSMVGAEAPDWLTDNLKELRKEIRQRMQDSLERRLSEAKSRLESLSTTEEKRDRLRAEIASLSSKLGVQ